MKNAQRETIDLMVKILISAGLIILIVLTHISGHSTDFILTAENEFSILDLKTVGSGFCHTGYSHLLGNLVGFVFALPAVIHLQAVWVVPTTFLFSCWTGSFAHIVLLKLQNEAITPLCGASGGVYGLLTVAALSSLKTESRFFKLWLPAFYTTLILVGFLASTQDVSVAAHIGGVFGGLVVALLAKLVELLRRSDKIKYSMLDNEPLHSNRNDFVWDRITV